MAAKTLMIQGTASHVGKSVLTAALCRIFQRRGHRVAPFKAQNMSNNSFVTPDGKEIGRAQAVQAAACRLPPRADFNPVLIKPSGDRTAQVVVNGMVAGCLSAREFGQVRRMYWEAVAEAFHRVAADVDLVILEGAGSPAEINLRDHDIVNMAMAREARAPVLLVGDVDRGGVFAALVGTIELLESAERRHVKGFVINKFRGSLELLLPGVTLLTERTAIRCMGVMPHWHALRVPQEDSMGWDSWRALRPHVQSDRSSDASVPTLAVGVVDVPCLANSTDLEALAREPDVRLVRVRDAMDDRFDALILPGTKSTVQALQMIRAAGLEQVIRRVLADGGSLVGLCGGYQILGRRLHDPHRVDSPIEAADGLGILDAVTVFERAKVTRQVTGVHRSSGCPIQGYEVHMGRTTVQAAPLFDLTDGEAGGWRPEGAAAQSGRVLGTYVHGLFDAPAFRRVFLDGLRTAKGWTPLGTSAAGSLDDDLDALADFVAAHLDVEAVDEVIQRGV
jgi:cobyric acid synthase CobQ